MTPLLFDFDEASILLRLAAATAWLTPISTLLLRTLQLWQRPYVYVLMSILQFVVTMIVTIMLVLFFKRGVIGVLIGQLAGVGVIACSCILILGTRLRYGIDPSLAKLLLRFSIPLVPTGFAALVISLSDRFFLEHYSTLHQLGLYAVADKMTAALSVLVVTPLLLSWNQYAFSNHRSPEFAVVFRCTLRLITVVLAFGILGYSLIIRELLTIATTPEFGAAWTMVPILCAAPVGHALITLFATGIHLSQQTRWIPLLYGSGMVSNLILNAALVPKYGMAGAAWATLVSSLATAGSFYLCARRVYVLDYPIRQMVITLVLAAGCTTLFVLFTQIMASCWLEWVIRILLVMSFGLLLWLFGIIEPNDIPMLTRLWNRLRRHFP